MCKTSQVHRYIILLKYQGNVITDDENYLPSNEYVNKTVIKCSHFFSRWIQKRKASYTKQVDFYEENNGKFDKIK